MKQFITLFFLLQIVTSVFSQSIVKTSIDNSGNTYNYFENSPLNCRIYTLKNGLTVFINVNKDAPRIATYICIKAGSTYDPQDNTGLAHYLEHMMFKGSSQIGTKNWDAEAPLLKEISDLYETHKATQDTLLKKQIYAKIDSVSQVAAQYAIANEYDKMVAEIGAKNTNAYTSNEQTVYINDIPSNELERFLVLEKERFSNLSLRLFHTELEAVYEEFNMSQDKDQRQAYYAFLDALYPTHPYGQQTTLGKAEHLKNPSIEAIHKYWNTYYRPNNMALCLSGDMDYENTIKIVESTLGKLESQEIKPIVLPKETPINEPITKIVTGPNEEFMFLGYRTNGASQKDKYKLDLLTNLLFNETAGLIDLNINQSQKALFVYAASDIMKDYGFLMFYGRPRVNQSLDEVQALILEQVEKVKKGEFEDWQLQAIINNLKLEKMKAYESNTIAHNFAESFSLGLPWIEYLNYLSELEKITKQDIVNYANELCKDNFIVVKKLTGENTSAIKVPKPKITPVPINRDEESTFMHNFKQIESTSIKPVFVKFNEKIQTQTLSNGIELKYIKNEDNNIFKLYYITEMGKHHDPLLSLAVSYLQYLGTNKYTSEELSLELYKNALSFGVETQDDISYVYLSGLQSSFAKGVELLEHIMSQATQDTAKYNTLVEDILKARIDAKLNKDAIQKALVNYGKYGAFSPFTNILSAEELKAVNPSDLVAKIKSLNLYKHEVFYYGAEDIMNIYSILNKQHKAKISLTIPEPKQYPYLENNTEKVFFVNYDMVQTNMILLSKKNIFDKAELPYIEMFNNYFGTSMSSIVFQELRESRALAYMAYSYISKANKATESNFLVAVIATSVDKLSDATSAMKELHSTFTKADLLFSNSKQSLLKQMETQRITKENIYFSNRRNLKLGIDYDIREDIYNTISKMSIGELEAFFNKDIKDNKFTYLIIGNKKDIDMKLLNDLGEVKELSLEEVFGY